MPHVQTQREFSFHLGTVAELSRPLSKAALVLDDARQVAKREDTRPARPPSPAPRDADMDGFGVPDASTLPSPVSGDGWVCVNEREGRNSAGAPGDVDAGASAGVGEMKKDSEGPPREGLGREGARDSPDRENLGDDGD